MIEIEETFVDKHIKIIMPALTILTCIMVFAVGMVAGGVYICESNNGTLTGLNNCMLDKCLEDISVCKEGNEYYIIPKDQGELNWTGFI